HSGFKPSPPPRYVATVDADLGLATRNGTVRQHYSPAEQLMWRQMLTAIANERGYKAGWVSHKFKEKFGVWPPFGSVKPVPPIGEVVAWVQSRQIAYAKAKATSATAQRVRVAS